MSTLEDHLKLVGEFMQRNGGKSLELFVLEHGKRYKHAPLPDELSYGYAKRCFENAAQAAYGKYTYCEGFAYTPGCGFPIHHAWVVDEDGNAYDVTWQDGGKQCGFCLGEGTNPENDEEDEDCYWCNGTGELEWENHSRAGTEYYGIEFSHAEWCKWAMELQTYDLLCGYANAVEAELAGSEASSCG